MGQDNRLIPGTAPTTATAATATATLAAMTASSTASPAGALFAWPGLIHRQGAAFQVFARHALNGRLRAFRCGHGDESKPARAASGTVGHEIDFTHRAEGDEGVLQIVFRHLEGKIPHE